MEKMHVETNCARHLSQRHRPCGYVFIKSINLQEKNPVYWGEFEIKADAEYARFCYTIDFLDPIRRYYQLQIFKDRDFEWRLARCHMDLSNCSGNSAKGLKPFPVIETTKVAFMPNELWFFIHLIIKERLIEEMLPELQRIINENPLLPPMKDIQRIFGIDDEAPENFFNDTFVRFGDFVSTMKLVLE